MTPAGHHTPPASSTVSSGIRCSPCWSPGRSRLPAHRQHTGGGVRRLWFGDGDVRVAVFRLRARRRSVGRGPGWSCGVGYRSARGRAGGTRGAGCPGRPGGRVRGPASRVRGWRVCGWSSSVSGLVVGVSAAVSVGAQRGALRGRGSGRVRGAQGLTGVPTAAGVGRGLWHGTPGCPRAVGSPGADSRGRGYFSATVALSITTVALGTVAWICGSTVEPASAIFFRTSMPWVICPNGV